MRPGDQLASAPGAKNPSSRSPVPSFTEPIRPVSPGRREGLGFITNWKEVEMNNFVVIVLTLLPASLSVGIAGFLAAKGLPGWGWFLFAALVLASKTVRYSDEPDNATNPARQVERSA